MDKKLLLTIGLSGLIVLNTSAQLEQPPNGGFENWQTIGIGEDPVNWASGNQIADTLSFYPILISKTTDANSGAYALKVRSDTATLLPPLGDGSLDTVQGRIVLGADLTGGIPFTSKPDSIKYFMKFVPAVGGWCQIDVVFTKWNTSEGKRDWVGAIINPFDDYDTIISYTEMTSAVAWLLPDSIPDSLFITITAGRTVNTQPGNVLYIDDFSFVYNTTGINDIEANAIKIFPTLVDESLFIEGVDDNKDLTITIHNVLGKLVMSRQIDDRQRKIKLDVGFLSAGLYLLRFEHNKSIVTKKFIKR